MISQVSHLYWHRVTALSEVARIGSGLTVKRMPDMNSGISVTRSVIAKQVEDLLSLGLRTIGGG